MAKRHKSGIKRAKQDAVKRLRHRKAKEELKKAVKSAKSSKSNEALNKAYSVIDKASKKGVLHWKTAARKKSRLTKSIIKTAKPTKSRKSSKPKTKTTAKPKTAKTAQKLDKS
jgi:small subunit ribosomal protein S20